MGLKDAIRNNPHLEKHIKKFYEEHKVSPLWYDHLERDMAKMEYPNVIYPVGDPIFIHIHRIGGWNYIAIEPEMNNKMREKYDMIKGAILHIGSSIDIPDERKEFIRTMDNLLNRVTTMKVREKTGFLAKYLKGEIEKIYVTKEEYEIIKYYLHRDILQMGPLEPVVRDPYIEDIHVVGTRNIHIVHKLFGTLPTNIKFKNRIDLEKYLRNISERIGNPVSDASPIIDAALPDGSRINIIYSEDISREGSSFTIRKFTEKPLTLPYLIYLGTMSPLVAAYLWLCVEFGMNVFVCGETASGKTTTLNSLLPFINHRWKIYSAEDTPEVIAPHSIWQRVITRETSTGEANVELYDLVRAALRSRPNYIVIGEIRGKEGSAAFQAMQTGHYVLSTFHAPSVTQMIQRLTGAPINIPERFMDNLNVVVFQQIVYEHGRILRRVISLDEILKYSKMRKGILTRNMFSWDPVQDKHFFRGINNSYILENKIAPKLKYHNVKRIYDDLEERAKILRRMVEKRIFDYDDVVRLMRIYYDMGLESLKKELRRA